MSDIWVGKNKLNIKDKSAPLNRKTTSHVWKFHTENPVLLSFLHGGVVGNLLLFKLLHSVTF